MAFGNSILGGGAPASILGGGAMPPRIPWGQNRAVTMAALGMLGAPTLNEGMRRAATLVPAGLDANQASQQFAMAQQEKATAKAESEADAARRRAALNVGLKLKSGLVTMETMSPADRAAWEAVPEVALQFYPEKEKPMVVGGKIYEPSTGEWKSPPGGAASGPYEGTGMDAQNWNIVLTGDPATPEYAAAYSQLFSERTVPTQDAAGNQVLVPIKPVIPPGVRAPVGMNQPQRPDQRVPEVADGGDSRVGEPIVIGTPKPTDSAMNAALYADRMAKSNEIITSLERAGTSYVDRAASQVPAGIGNYLISDDYRQLDQAQRDFINATLRRESGAVISPEEFDNARKQYFPQPGDDPQTIENKRENRQTAIDGIARAAGASYKPPTGGVISLDEWLKQNP